MEAGGLLELPPPLPPQGPHRTHSQSPSPQNGGQSLAQVRALSPRPMSQMQSPQTGGQSPGQLEASSGPMPFNDLPFSHKPSPHSGGQSSGQLMAVSL